MPKIPNIKSVMTPFPYSIQANRPLVEALEMMKEHDFRHLPVVDGRNLVGVLSERLLGRASEQAEDSQHTLTVRDAPIGDACVVDIDERLDNVALAMADRHQGSAVVLKDGRVAGIFTSTDACRCLGEFLRSDLPVSGDDVA